MARNPPSNVELLLRGRYKNYIRLGDEAISQSAWYRFRRFHKLADKANSLKNNRLADRNTIPHNNEVTENIVIPNNNSEVIENAYAELPTNSDAPIDFDSALTNLILDVPTVTNTKDDYETSNIPNELCNDDEERNEACDNHNCDVHDKHPENNQSFVDLFNTTEYYATKECKSAMSQAELHLLLLKLGLKNHLSHTGLSEFAQALNFSAGKDMLPETRYMLDKTFNGIINVEYHALCHKCSLYLGERETATQLSNCPHCNEKLELMNPSSVNYFLIIDPSESIKRLLEEFQDFYYHVLNERQSEENHIKDIYDGYCYRKLINSLSEDERKQYLTVNLNTDGAPRFESSTYSIWPIYLMPNEVPMQHRSPIVCGLWFGKHKPSMIPFLMPFIEAFNRFSQNGIACTIKNAKLNIKLFVACVPVDAVARAPMQGLKQFNGYFACNWCEQEGVYENGVRYPYIHPKAPTRNPESMLRDMIEAVNNDSCNKGVQSLSPLLQLKYFNIVLGFVPEYLHAALAGVGPQLTEILIKYLSPQQIALADQLLLKIKAPNQITRLSRPLTDRAQWKAREWENWILYYSLPLFTFFLQREHPEKVEHWSYFVKSLHILLGNDITIDKLNKADNMLHKFVKYVGVIYKDLGFKPSTFNLHQMLHMASSVYNWGPLYTHSAFAFESANMEILQAIKCAKGVIQQIARYINLQYCLSMLEKRVYPTTSPLVKQYYNMKTVQKTFKLTSTGPVYFGTGTLIGREKLEQFDLSLNNTRGFLKMVKCGCLYSSSRKDNDRSCNYYAQLEDGKFIKIDLFAIDQERRSEFTICYFVNTKSTADTCNPMKIVENISTQLHKVYTKDIRTVCIFLTIGNIKYICPMPNLYHY